MSERLWQPKKGCQHGLSEWEDLGCGRLRKVCKFCGAEIEKPKKKCGTCRRWGASSKFSGEWCGTCKKKRKRSHSSDYIAELENGCERDWREGRVEEYLRLYLCSQLEDRLYSCRSSGAVLEIRVPWKSVHTKTTSLSFCCTSDHRSFIRLGFEYDVFSDIFENRLDRKPCIKLDALLYINFALAHFTCSLRFVSGTAASRRAVAALQPNIHSLPLVQKLLGYWSRLREGDRHEALAVLTLNDPKVRHALYSAHFWPIVCHFPCAELVLNFLGCDFEHVTTPTTRQKCGLDLLAEIGSNAERRTAPVAACDVGVQVLVGIGRSKAAKLAKHGITTVNHLANLDVDANADLAKAVTGNRNATQAARTLSGWRDAALKYLTGRQQMQQNAAMRLPPAAGSN